MMQKKSSKFSRRLFMKTGLAGAISTVLPSSHVFAKNNNIDYSELRIGMDGLSVMVNPNNDFVDCLTISELHVIWKPGSKIIKWIRINGV